MPGWIFVSALLAAATVLAVVADRPLAMIAVLAAATVGSAVAGALVRPDRQSADPRDRPPR